MQLINNNLMATTAGFILGNLEDSGILVNQVLDHWPPVYLCCSQDKSVSWQGKKGFHLHLTVCQAWAVSCCLGPRQRQIVMKGPAAQITSPAYPGQKIYVDLKFKISSTANGLNRAQRVDATRSPGSMVNTMCKWSSLPYIECTSQA